MLTPAAMVEEAERCEYTLCQKQMRKKTSYGCTDSANKHKAR